MGGYADRSCKSAEEMEDISVVRWRALIKSDSSKLVEFVLSYASLTQ